MRVRRGFGDKSVNLYVSAYFSDVNAYLMRFVGDTRSKNVFRPLDGRLRSQKEASRLHEHHSRLRMLLHVACWTEQLNVLVNVPSAERDRINVIHVRSSFGDLSLATGALTKLQGEKLPIEPC